MGGEPRQVVGHGLAGARQDERASADHGPQEDLQTAVAANVVEGAPHRRSGGRLDRRGEARDGVADQLGNARGARGQQHPFGLPAAHRQIVLRLDRRAAFGVKRDTECVRIGRAGVGRAAIGHDRIDLGGRDDGAKMVLRHAWRANDETARDAVQLDHRERRCELVTGGKENRAPLQGAEPAAETRTGDEIGERDARARAPEMPRRTYGTAEPSTQRRGVTLQHFRRRARSRRESRESSRLPKPRMDRPPTGPPAAPPARQSTGNRAPNSSARYRGSADELLLVLGRDLFDFGNYC